VPTSATAVCPNGVADWVRIEPTNVSPQRGATNSTSAVHVWSAASDDPQVVPVTRNAPSPPSITGAPLNCTGSRACTVTCWRYGPVPVAGVKSTGDHGRGTSPWYSTSSDRLGLYHHWRPENTIEVPSLDSRGVQR
jgi:hypothetical protein